MQCEDVGIGVPSPCLNELDSVLNELGMLATGTKSRNEYLSEIQNRKFLNMLTINTRYVSNVSIGFRVRPAAPHVRYKPYRTPKERHRTRSENNDNDVSNLLRDVVDDCLENALEITQLKKSKSLESIIAENSKEQTPVVGQELTPVVGQELTPVVGQELTLGNVSELEVVSKSIQNLKVAE